MTISFKSLGLSDNQVEHLETIGFAHPTTIQIEAIPQVLGGRDVVGQSQTGTGKTAAYSLPILDKIDFTNNGIQALILTPTRELAQQVAEAIKDLAAHRRLHVLTVYGGQSIDRQIRSLERGVDIVVGTPGRVIDLLDRKKLHFDQVRWVVLDEADEMLSMGFIDDVKKILSRTPKERQTACFSATMPREIRELVDEFLTNPVTVTGEQHQSTPTKIEQHVYMIPRGWSKLRSLQPILELEAPESAIIFVRTKRTASELTSKLQESGHSVDEYHGNLSQSQRERLVQRWREGKVRLVVATDIAARGLDLEHLTHVINYDLPDNPETYIHRIGRTGRAGKTGTAICLVEPIDRRMLRQIEHRVKQSLKSCQIPDRALVEARRLEKLQTQVKESLAGERMASFLPIVRELSGEYDPLAIAAATLQMVYDQNCPNWLKTEWEVPTATYDKPKINRKSNRRPEKGNYNSRSANQKYQDKPSQVIKLNNRKREATV
jgi:ATP-dependent RNA helicase DeaD